MPGAYFFYMYTRSLVFDDFEATALANAAKIISLERSLGFFWEPDWQAWAIDGVKALVVFFNWTYIFTFWPIILTAGTILYIRDRPRYIYYRNIVLLSFALALIGFMLFPLAPPRMIAEHFVDTIKAFGPTFYASREFANFYNPYAAMPSLHFSWTVMFGVLFLTTPNKWVKILGIIYPTTTPVGHYHNRQSLHYGCHRRRRSDDRGLCPDGIGISPQIVSTPDNPAVPGLAGTPQRSQHARSQHAKQLHWPSETPGTLSLSSAGRTGPR